jgi:RNA polymerase sigma-70 factor, ECF subfamily
MFAMMRLPKGAAVVAEPETADDFDEFFRAVYTRVSQALLLLTRDPAEAEDLAQEALLRAFERWDRVRRMQSPEGYVYRTAMNLNRKRLRRLAVRRRRSIAEGPTPDPTAIVEERSLAASAIAALTREQREALVLVEWLGLSTEEAGRVLAIDAASIRSRLSRARAALRRHTELDDD